MGINWFGRRKKSKAKSDSWRRHKDTLLFHHAVRIGREGRPLVVSKFRTMSRNALQEEKKVYAQGATIDAPSSTKKDPRVTAFGRFLRRTHLDELPQFWMVLTGKLNLVGIRPLQRKEYHRLPRRIQRIYKKMGPALGAIAYACKPFPPSKEQLYAEYESFYKQWKLNPKRTYIKYAWKIFWNKIQGNAPAR